MANRKKRKKKASRRRLDPLVERVAFGEDPTLVPPAMQAELDKLLLFMRDMRAQGVKASAVVRFEVVLPFEDE